MILKKGIRDTLQEIGRKYKTDKGSHHFKGVTYLHIYDLYFRHYRRDPMNILELGVKKGASLRMWKEYFFQGQIFGLDIDSKCKQYEQPRIHIEIGHQDDRNVLDRIRKKAKGGFDIVLDDCSHLNELTIKSFSYLWQFVKSGGYYVIEDLRNSYTKDMKSEMKKGNWVARDKQKKSTLLINERGDMDKLFLELIRQMDYRDGDIGAVHFFPMICIIGKS